MIDGLEQIDAAANPATGSAAPIRPPFRMASKPGLGMSNRYIELFYRALGPHGVELTTELDVSGRWLAENAGRVDAVHFHWPEKVWRSHVPTWLDALQRRRVRGAWRAIRATRPLRKGLGLLRLERFLDAARRAGVKVVWTAHNIEPHEGADALDRAGYRLLAARSDLIVCHGRDAFRALAERYPHAGRLAIMPIGNYDGVYAATRERGAVLREFGLHDDLPMLCCPGELRDYKGLDRACEAVDRLGGSVQLAIAGAPDPTFDLGALQRRVAGKSWVALRPGPLSDREFADLVAASDAALLPYRKVTGSAVLLAALTLGRGAVATDLPFFRETLDPEPDAGRLVPGDDPGALAAAIPDYLSVPAERRQTAARRLADRHAWDVVVRPVAAVLREWASARAPGRS